MLFSITLSAQTPFWLDWPQNRGLRVNKSVKIVEDLLMVKDNACDKDVLLGKKTAGDTVGIVILGPGLTLDHDTLRIVPDTALTGCLQGLIGMTRDDVTDVTNTTPGVVKLDTNALTTNCNNLLTVKAWLLGGNAGTVAGVNYMGTQDNVDVVFKTNAVERMRITANGNVGIGAAPGAYRLYVDGMGLITKISQGGDSLMTAYFGDDEIKLTTSSSGGSLAPYLSVTPNGTIKFADAIKTIVPSGKFGVGYSNPSQRVDVAGSIKLDSALIIKPTLYTDTAQTIDNNVTKAVFDFGVVAATATITLPATPVEGQHLDIYVKDDGVLALVLSPNGRTFNFTPPTTLNGSSPIKLFYADGVWLKN